MTRPAAAVGAHGPFDSTTEKCEKCHAMHTGGTPTLLTKISVQGLCLSCHSAGAGADTAVMQGALMHEATPGEADYVVTGSLLGGGFEKIAGAVDTTSRHDMLAYAVPPGAENTGASVFMQCVSCHSPHDNPNYRLLRTYMNGNGIRYEVSWNGPASLPDGTTDHQYDESDFDAAAPGTQYYTFNYRSGLSTWCSSCHTRYMTRTDSSGYDAGDNAGAKARYRHAVDVPVMGRYNIYNPATTYDLPTDLPLQDASGDGSRTVDDSILCLTCHMAHGGKAVMGAAIDAQASTRGNLPTDSMLLRMNDRQVCQVACHKVVN